MSGAASAERIFVCVLLGGALALALTQGVLGPGDGCGLQEDGLPWPAGASRSCPAGLDLPAAGRVDLSGLLRGEMLLRPWLLLALVGLVSVLEGASLALRARVKTKPIHVLERQREASLAGPAQPSGDRS